MSWLWAVPSVTKCHGISANCRQVSHKISAKCRSVHPATITHTNTLTQTHAWLQHVTIDMEDEHKKKGILDNGQQLYATCACN